MGAWGTGIFDNDDALDWLGECQAEGIQVAAAALADVLELKDEFLEAPLAARALAAAEAIAAASGKPGKALPQELTDWVMTESELRDL